MLLRNKTYAHIAITHWSNGICITSARSYQSMAMRYIYICWHYACKTLFSVHSPDTFCAGTKTIPDNYTACFGTISVPEHCCVIHKVLKWNILLRIAFRDVQLQNRNSSEINKRKYCNFPKIAASTNRFRCEQFVVLRRYCSHVYPRGIV